MDENELHARLALNRIAGVGPRTFQILLARFGSAGEAFQASRRDLVAIPELGDAGRDAIRAGIEATGVAADIEWLRLPGHTVTCLGGDGYPPLLALIAQPPPVLFLHGDPERLCRPQLAMVGSRNPTASGAEHARAFAAYLSRAGFTITSGLATGIDSAAHEGALTGLGGTVAVAATGLDRVYPASNRDLAHRVAEQGLLVSEYPVGSGPLKQHFPRRNRIISGLSLGCLVVEAARHSGSLITARYAAEQGREVFAIPGSIHSPLSRGCHYLIRQGAKLVETAQDIVEELPPIEAPPGERPDTDDPPAAPATSEEMPRDVDDPLLAVLDFEPATLDLLVERSGLPVEAVSARLLDLELQGLAEALDGGRYRRHEASE